jgi:uncharacterized protein (DUF4415 family)
MAKQAKKSKSAPASPSVTPQRAAGRPRSVPAESNPALMDMLKLQVNWPHHKQPVNLRIDTDIVDWFRGGGAGYQTRMNAVLRAFFDAQQKRR